MAVESYGDAVLSAAREKSFPSEMPWALADALRDDFIWTDILTVTNRSQWPVFMPARRMLREIMCRIAGANQQNSRSVTAGRDQTYGPEVFDMHESSRLNMSFKCSGSFNIIYIMRTNGKDGGNWRYRSVPSLVTDRNPLARDVFQAMLA